MNDPVIRCDTTARYGWPLPTHLCRASLQYDPADPYAITLVLADEDTTVEWRFARDLLDQAMRRSGVGIGDVRLTRVEETLLIYLGSCHEPGVVSLPIVVADECLTLSYWAVPPRRESVDIDRLLTDLLGGAQ